MVVAILHVPFTYLTPRLAQPRNAHSQFVDIEADPDVDKIPHWDSFGNRFRFQFASLVYERMQASEANINDLLMLWTANNVAYHDGAEPVFENIKEIHKVIDDSSYGPTSWEKLVFRYPPDAVDDNSPKWKSQPYIVHTRNSLRVVEAIAGNPEFDGRWDYAPFEDYDRNGERQYSHLMSGQWAWDMAVCNLRGAVCGSRSSRATQDTLAEDEHNLGSMLVPIILGADKTTVSVATGNTEYHPVYISVGNLHNGARRSHEGGLTLLAFLAIPKCTSSSLPPA
jgi:hypothetical protein